MPPVRRIPLTVLKHYAEWRAPGYLEDVLAAGRIVGDCVELSEAAFQALRQKYRDPQPRANWPRWAKAIAWLKADADAGVGDTIARVIGPVGGAAFKAWFKKLTGHSCGCVERQEELNRQYPYARAADATQSPA